MIHGWLAMARDAFWDLAGPPPPFPRDLRPLLALALPLSSRPVPGLRLAVAETWLARHGCSRRFGEPDRRLRGALVAFADTGVLFLDGADLDAEQRFTAAHEAAHFVLDYLLPRRRALALLGEGVRSVLDGERAPSREERIDAALTDCPLGIHVHLLDRRDPTGAVAAVEDRADRLARELLAPAADVAERYDGLRLGEAELSAELTRVYGLPPAEAVAYARRWLGSRPTALLGGLRP